MKTYTVLLMYPDYLAEPHYGEETWLWVGEAHDASQALARAQCDARDNNVESEAEDFAHVITFEGACTEVARHGCIFEPFTCNGCGRPEDDCSRDPCPDVIADRGEDDPQQSIVFSWFDDTDPIERMYREAFADLPARGCPRCGALQGCSDDV